MRRTLTLLLACALAAPLPLAAQGDLLARMQAFLREVPVAPNTGLVAYFPRRGDWTWVQTLRDIRGAPAPTGIWRVPGAQTERAIGRDGPVCDSFDQGRGHSGPFEGRFGMQVMLNRGEWRRVGGTRFVPPGASASSPVFVEWRREDDRWVVSSFGDEDVIHTGRIVEQPRGPFVHDRTPVAQDTAFAPADWYTITVDGGRHPTYGRPRAMDRAALVRIGHLFGVNVYVERREMDGFLFLPVAPGQFQAYERRQSAPCD
jgi:hypothetical protein